MKLVVLKGANIGREFPLYEGNNIIGRWDPDTSSFPEVDLDEEDTDAKVSRKHAALDLKGSQVVLEDLGSRNGTFVNRGTRLEPGTQHTLTPGDEIILGKVVVKLVSD